MKKSSPEKRRRQQAATQTGTAKKGIKKTKLLRQRRTPESTASQTLLLRRGKALS
jgi:hypothetical protein